MENFEVRDTRNGEWFWVYSSVISDQHITPGDKLFYSALATFGGYEVIKPSLGVIAKRCALSERAAIDSIRKLEEVGYIKVERRGGRHLTNIYYLLKRPKGCIMCIVSEGKGEPSAPERVNETAPEVDRIDKDNTISLIDEDGNEIRPKSQVRAYLALYAKLTKEYFDFEPVFNKGGIIMLQRFSKKNSIETWGDYIKHFYSNPKSFFYKEDVAPDLKILLGTSFINNWLNRKK